MPLIVGILMLGVLVSSINDYHVDNGTFEGRSNVVHAALNGSSSTTTSRKTQHVVRRTTTAQQPLPAMQGAGSSAYADAERIIRVAKQYGVPEGALFGIWMKESSGRKAGWGEHWMLASDLPKRSGGCRQAYGAKRSGWCADQWTRIRAICAQKTSDGRATCDARTVRVSAAGALGPMQHLPTTMLKQEGDRLAWGAHAIDGNGDGVVDPHNLDDAMPMTASLIRRHYDRAVARGSANPWRAAVIAYSGVGNDPYYNGRRGSHGVGHYWSTWQQCRTAGDCPAVIARLQPKR